MIRRLAAIVGIVVLCAAPALAEAPEQSARPSPRPVSGTASATIPADIAGSSLFRKAPAAASQRPMAKSDATVEKAFFGRKRRKAAICGDPKINGAPIGDIPARISGCGISDAVRVVAVDDVALSTPITVDCTTARSLRFWVSEVVKPVVGREGGGIAQLQVAAHYACRPRNNQAGAKVSEHGRGRAIDISGFVMRNGRSFTLLQDWGGGKYGRMLRQMHKGACGPFGTVLGPDSDRFHRDHFHFDTARYRKGSYCR